MNKARNLTCLFICAIMVIGMVLPAASLTSGNFVYADSGDAAGFLDRYSDYAAMRAWIKNNIEDTDAPPVSFTLGGRSSSSFLWTKTVGEEETVVDYAGTDRPAQRKVRDIVYVCASENIRIRLTLTAYPDYPVIEYDAHIDNLSGGVTEAVGRFMSVDAPIASYSGNTVLHYNQGSYGYLETEYQPFTQTLSATAARFSTSSGMPTCEFLPYFNAEDQAGGGGVITAVNWQGAWEASFSIEGGNVKYTAGQSNAGFCMKGGESFKYPGTVLLFYKNGDWQEGQNVWRRWVVEHNLMRNTGRRDYAENVFVCSGFPGAERDLADIRAFAGTGIQNKYNCTFEYDAGWYVSDPNAWFGSVGNWSPTAAYSNGGLRRVSDLCHSYGMDFCMWFEPERLYSTTDFARTLGDGVIYLSGSRYVPYSSISGGSEYMGLINYGNKNTEDAVVAMLDRAVKEYGIDVYRQDFNTSNGKFWTAYDNYESASLGYARSGATENHACEGYINAWTRLEELNPGLIFDACAGGGRRYDLETMRFAFVHTKSDYWADQKSQQCQNLGMYSWNVFTGTGFTDMNSTYDIRTRLSLSIGVGISTDPSLDAALAEWETMHKYIYCDYYALTPYSLDDSANIAMQFNSPEQGGGMAVAYLRAGGSFTLKLRGLDAEAEYRIWDGDLPGETVISGEKLMNGGYRAVRGGAPSAVKIFYEKVTDPEDAELIFKNPANAAAATVVPMNYADHYYPDTVPVQGVSSIVDAWPSFDTRFDRGITYMATEEGAAVLSAAIAGSSDGTVRCLSEEYSLPMANTDRVYIFNGRPGDAGFGTKVADNLYAAYGACLSFTAGSPYVWAGGLWRTDADRTLEDGVYTFVLYAGDGPAVAFTDYVCQNFYEGQGYGYTQGGYGPAGAVKISSQPADYYGDVGDTATFTVTASGDGLTYQWQVSKDGAVWSNIKAANADTLSVVVTSTKINVYMFRCVITDAGGGTLTTDAARMKKAAVIPEIPLEITAQPTDHSGNVGDTATFTVTATGDGLAYQWQTSKDGGVLWTDIKAANANMLSAVVTKTKINVYMFRCVITDRSGGTVTSDPVMMVQAPAPLSITVQPENYEGDVGGVATFTVTASGEDVGYQWQSSVDGAVWTDVTSANSATLTLIITQAKLGVYRFRCVLTDGGGNTLTSDEVMMIKAVPHVPLAVTSQPADYYGDVGDTAAFTVTAEGDGPAYQWQVSKDGALWSDIKAANADTLSVVVTKTKINVFFFRCVITDRSGETVTTDAVRMIKNQTQDPPVINYADPAVAAAATVVPMNYADYYYPDTVPVQGISSIVDAWPSFDTRFDRGITYMATEEGATVLSEAVIRSSGGGTVAGLGAGYSFPMANTDMVYVFNGRIGDADFGTRVADNLYEKHRACLAYGSGTGPYFWVGGLWRTDGERTLEDGVYTFVLYAGDGSAVAFTDYVCQNFYEANGYGYTQGGYPVSAPEISSQPVNYYGNVGDTATFTVTAEGEGLTYQWQVSKDGSSWSDIKAANANMLSVVVTKTKINVFFFRCVITDGSGSAITTDAVRMIKG